MTTMTEDLLWAHVNAALDERRDPLSDPGVREALERASGHTDDVRRLVSRLGALPPRRATRGRLLAAAAAVLVAGAATLGLTLSWPRATGLPTMDVTLVVEHTGPPPARVARVVLEPERVLAWTLEGDRR